MLAFKNDKNIKILMSLERYEAIVFTGTFPELYIIQSYVACVATTSCSLKHDLKQTNENWQSVSLQADILPHTFSVGVYENVVVQQDQSFRF